MKILAVDDDLVFLELLVRQLRLLGHGDVTTASSAREALSILHGATRPYDCLLLDIQMPEINGVQLCQVVRGLEAYRRTPIVMITAMSGKSFVDDAFSAGATDYVTKPLDQLELKARMRTVARLHEDRQRMAALQRQATSNVSLPDFHLDFSAPLLLPGIARGFEYLALENYLLTLGIKRLHSVGALAISIENAELIFSKTTPSTFVNVLGDVATAILDGLKTEKVMLAYAGNGIFGVLVQRDLSIEMDDLALTIDLVLEDFEPIYTADRIPSPRVRIGELVWGSIFSSTKPTRILGQAIESVQPKSRTKTQRIAIA